jgi:hypothetical protein
MNARAWFAAQSFNGRLNEQEAPLRVTIQGCDQSASGRVVRVLVNGKPIQLAFGPMDYIPASEEIIRRAKQAYQGGAQ